MGTVIPFNAEPVSRSKRPVDQNEVKRALRSKLRKVGLSDAFLEFTWPQCEALIYRFYQKPGVDKELLMALLQLRINLDLEKYARLERMSH